MNIAIIPARGGSKRIPRKNIKIFNGKPMIAHAINAACSSGLFEHVVVSTDDAEISAIACEWGAEVPFVRPAELANDYTATAPVIKHAVENCRDLGWQFDRVCCIYPGVPFIENKDVHGALHSLQGTGADYCFPITEFPAAIQRALKQADDGRLKPFYPLYETTRTQDLEKAYYDAGQFYWGTADAWLNNARIHSSGVGYVIPNWRVVDIDTEEDWRRAEVLNKVLRELGESTQ